MSKTEYTFDIPAPRTDEHGGEHSGIDLHYPTRTIPIKEIVVKLHEGGGVTLLLKTTDPEIGSALIYKAG